MKKLLIALAIFGVVVAAMAVYIQRDGSLVVTQGKGIVSLSVGEFEAFPLPEYAAQQISSDYKSYLIEVEPGIKVHVLEVGSGYPVFLQHGNPTSGFLYRKVAAELPTERLRLIMPTLVGLGFSSKVSTSQHSVENHARWINSVLSKLELQELVYVGQDWGGPVGMGALALSPELVKGAVILNTVFRAPTEKRDLSKMHASLKRPLVGELAVEVFDQMFSSLPKAQGDPDSMNEGVIQLYRDPVMEGGNKKAPLAMIRMVPDGPEHPSSAKLGAIGDYAAGLEVPIEIVWGMRDPILGPGLADMKAIFPNAPVTETQGGHFLQEEVPLVIADAIVRVVDQVSSADSDPE
jgi:haloalkane dehalogenase